MEGIPRSQGTFFCHQCFCPFSSETPVFVWAANGVRRVIAAGQNSEYLAGMTTAQPTTVQHIEDAVRQLSRDELADFRAWFAEFDAVAWDRQFEADASAGRLDWLVQEALQDLREGRCTER